MLLSTVGNVGFKKNLSSYVVMLEANSAAEASLVTNCMQVHVPRKAYALSPCSDKQTGTTELDMHMQHKRRCAQMSETGALKNTFHSSTHNPTDLRIHSSLQTDI